MAAATARRKASAVCRVIRPLCRSASATGFSPGYYTPVEMVGLYWHFVDIVWIFLYPLLYLLGRH